MTDPFPQLRKAGPARWIAPALLLAILALAAALRLHGIAFGLPALNDPDEPLFMMTAFDMLRNRTLNPGWFGHPGTITLYCLALVCLAVGMLGMLTGRFAGAEGFAEAVYADPGIVFLPARLFVMACALVCIVLTYRIGKRLGGERIGLIAAAMLAINAVHIEYSQIIRTDMQASVFMLLGALSALAILRDGRERDYVLAGLWVGLAAATKWPAALIAIAPLCTGFARLRAGQREWDLVILFAIAAVATLFLASPYLLLDYPAVLRDLAGEARTIHPGATGGGFLSNLAWYITGPLAGSFGMAGLALAGAGLACAAWRDRRWALVVLPVILLLLAVLCAQHLVWVRWVVPLLPFLALALAYALCALHDRLRARLPAKAAWAALPLMCALLAVPMLQTGQSRAAERAHDTRQAATFWIRQHVPAGHSVLVEEAAIDLLRDGRRVIFPLGAAGCIDAREALGGQIEYGEVENKRAASPTVDLGHVALERIASCRADYAIVTHYDRYRAAPIAFAEALQRYRVVLEGAALEAYFAPRAGESGGPVTYVYRLAPRSAR
ncbi:glycosyltransferase family 39 protein [Caenibius sp. WL]|uniref:ArnT family glycosyltransferase n=1 Tax=Caenibius sp. WL TaxID=2872646 RepID=UPI0021BD9A75|nr:glycosyltransferase family 39 protein [Caenibius sp. WL]